MTGLLFYTILWQAQTSGGGIIIHYPKEEKIIWSFCYFG